jgi:hypothetical protein
MPGRYVRYAIPAVPGIGAAFVSCRAVDDIGQHSLREHEIPNDAHIEIRIPGV